jgi:PqqD family protein of HPr-rel-A system
MFPSPQVRWRALTADALAWREWDGEVVVFNQQTGSTHLLGDLASEVFRRLIAADRGATVEALAAALTDDPLSANEAAWTRSVAEVLSEFARLGLAQPDTP